MNQQRSRRFRAVQEAKEKAEERDAGIAMFECTCVELIFSGTKADLFSLSPRTHR